MNNTVHIIGNVAQDPQLRSTSTGKSVLQLRVGETLRFGQREEKTFHNIVAWEGKAETLAKYVRKGDQLIIEGTLRYRDYLDREGNKKTITEIHLNNFEFGKKAGTHPEKTEDPFAEPAETIDYEELPF